MIRFDAVFYADLMNEIDDLKLCRYDECDNVM